MSPRRALDPVAQLRAALARHADPARAAVYRRFFKSGKGEYAEGDRFIGVRVPIIRAVARANPRVNARQALRLLASPIHEERMLALVLLVRLYERGDAAARQWIFEHYLANTRHINNWDLVDTSAPHIVGAHLEAGNRRLLERLARSASLWERRIAVLATLRFIRAGESDTALGLAARLIDDPHDLIHKAVGWMLREVGLKAGVPALEGFLTAHARHMPRTMLRYAIEHLPPVRRAFWLGRRAAER